MSVVDDIASFLESNSTAFTRFAGSTGNLARQRMIDDIATDTVTVVYETAGLFNVYGMSTSTGTADLIYEQPGFQILARSSDYPTARANADAAYDLLDGLAGRSLPTSTGTYYQEITAQQPPFFSGNDQNHRYIISTNYIVAKRR